MLERQPDIIQPFHQALPPERINREPTTPPTSIPHLLGGEVHRHLVPVPGVDQDDLRCLSLLRHPLVEVHSQGDDVSPTLVPGDRQRVAHVAEQMMPGTGGDLLDLKPDRTFIRRVLQRQGGRQSGQKNSNHVFPVYFIGLVPVVY